MDYTAVLPCFILWRVRTVWVLFDSYVLLFQAAALRLPWLQGDALALRVSWVREAFLLLLC